MIYVLIVDVLVARNQNRGSRVNCRKRNDWKKISGEFPVYVDSSNCFAQKLMISNDPSCSVASSICLLLTCCIAHDTIPP